MDRALADRFFFVRALALVAALAMPTAPSFAYRPFDGTDAAIAAPQEFELELGPAGLLREGARGAVVAPAIVLNYGIIPNWEAVLQGEGVFPYSAMGGRNLVRDNAALLKSVLRDGVLQGTSGPSIATEFGALLPDIHGERRSATGASLAGILSDRWGPLTAHFNLQAALSRAHQPDYFASTILEGPFEWPVRPVGEVFVERDAAAAETTRSGLVGAIWQAKENLSFDAAVRAARTHERTIGEIRLGLTIGFSLW